MGRKEEERREGHSFLSPSTFDPLLDFQPDSHQIVMNKFQYYLHVQLPPLQTRVTLISQHPSALGWHCPHVPTPIGKKKEKKNV